MHLERDFRCTIFDLTYFMRINFDFAVENYYNLVLEICSLRIFNIFCKKNG